MSSADQSTAPGLFEAVLEMQTALQRMRRTLETVEKRLAPPVAPANPDSEVLARTSHELRAPVNGVLQLTGLLLKRELTPEQLEFVRTLRRSTRAVLRAADRNPSLLKETGLTANERKLAAAVRSSAAALLAIAERHAGVLASARLMPRGLTARTRGEDS